MLDLRKLEELGIVVKENAALSEFTTFQLGGNCPAVLTCATPAQIESAITFLSAAHQRFIVFGGGSNLLVSDKGIDCAVVRYLSSQPLMDHEGYELHVLASSKLDDVVLYAAQQGLQGINYASGIPGTLGGAIIGNAGAFGKQIGDVVKSVTVLTRQGQQREVNSEEMRFSYRDSALKKSGDIVLKAKLLMTPANTVELLKERQDVLMMRWEKHPDFKTYPSAGSFFRNLEPTSKAGRRQAAGWFLEQVGAKQMMCGGAGVFEKHANIIIKRSAECRAQDVFELSQKMADAVRRFHGLELVREVRMVGAFTGASYDPQQVMW